MTGPTQGQGGGSTGLAARRAALRAIAAVEDEGAWSTRAVPDTLTGLRDSRDRAFSAHLAHDTLRWDGTLRWLLALVLTRDLADVEAPLSRILRLGALQLFRSGVPARAAVDTSVRLAREAVPRGRADGAARFVNGVLRNLARRLDAGIEWPDDEIEALALRTGHPTWVVDDLVGRLDDVESLLEADNRPPGVTLRSNVAVADLVAELAEAGVESHAVDGVPGAVAAPGADPRRLAAVTEGRAVPQDAASILVARATGAGPGDRVLDLCAGPGGKATLLAHLVGSEGHVTAVELHAHRAGLVEAAARRQGVDLEVLVGDGRQVPPATGSYDAVLLDAPCSGLGVGRRRPEIRWRTTMQAVRDLAGIQASLLRSAAGHVRPGGRLTYAVCTWTEQETTATVQQAAPAGWAELERRQLRPDTDGTDGMFVVTWQRPA